MTQDSLAKWIYNINCKINDKLNKHTDSFNKLCNFYESFKAGGCKKKNHKGKTCRKNTIKIPESKENLKLRLDNESSDKKTKKTNKTNKTKKQIKQKIIKNMFYLKMMFQLIFVILLF